MSERVAVVTGAARGIGAGVAVKLAADGFAVAVLDLEESAGKDTVERITAAGGRAIAIGADVSNAEAVQGAIERIAAELGPPVVLVNNAGVIRDNLLFKMTDDDWEIVMAVHLRGAFLMTRACQKFMTEAKWGRVVNLSSTSALGNRGQVNYSAAKAGLQGFTKTLAIELGPFGVTANAIAPGFIATEMTAATAARMGIDFETFKEGAAQQIPVRRVGYPEDIANTVSFLVSEGAGFVSGQVIYVAGGPVADITEADLQGRVAEFLAAHAPASTDRLEFLQARFDAGLAWVHFPVGLGGLGASRRLQSGVDKAFHKAGAPDNNPRRIGIGLGMAAPTILRHGTDEQKQRFLRPLWTGEEVWCQLFSEPGAGSDLAGLGTRAVRDGEDWVINGQKVWTSMAHEAAWAILVTRSNPDVPKHTGMTYFLCDMKAPGVEVRPLRQITGEAEFNEVFLTDVRIPDSLRIGAVGDGWTVAQTTLMNERVAIGGGPLPREGGMISALTNLWRNRPEVRTPGMQDAVLRYWVAAEAARLAGERLRQSLAAGQPGPEGSAQKLAFARLNQEISGLEMELSGETALRYEDWSMRRPRDVDFVGRSPGFRYLRAKGNSIEGGTSEILRNIVAERVLGLPGEKRVDVAVPWKDLAK